VKLKIISLIYTATAVCNAALASKEQQQWQKKKIQILWEVHKSAMETIINNNVVGWHIYLSHLNPYLKFKQKRT